MKKWPAFFVTYLVMIASQEGIADPYLEPRQQMVSTIEKQVVETARYIGKNKLNERVIEAMATVPRHEFVPTLAKPFAYFNRPLDIGHGQTISQPYIVALMTDLINPQPGHVVLEVGTGSGYQAAILSKLVKQVYTIEIIPQLATQAKKTLEKLGYKNISVRQGDGYQGWPKVAPFDGIIVTAGGDIPPRLIEQLKPGGRMIIPVGGPNDVQQLTLVEKKVDGSISKKIILPVRFVPLIGGG